MSNLLNSISENELSEELLNKVSGGVKRVMKSKPEPCKGNCGKTTTESLGYCKACQKSRAKAGTPIIL